MVSRFSGKQHTQRRREISGKQHTQRRREISGKHKAMSKTIACKQVSGEQKTQVMEHSLVEQMDCLTRHQLSEAYERGYQTQMHDECEKSKNAEKYKGAALSAAVVKSRWRKMARLPPLPVVTLPWLPAGTVRSVSR
jgi:hypothetical protein